MTLNDLIRIARAYPTRMAAATLIAAQDAVDNGSCYGWELVEERYAHRHDARSDIAKCMSQRTGALDRQP